MKKHPLLSCCTPNVHGKKISIYISVSFKIPYLSLIEKFNIDFVSEFSLTLSFPGGISTLKTEDSVLLFYERSFDFQILGTFEIIIFLLPRPFK